MGKMVYGLEVTIIQKGLLGYEKALYICTRLGGMAEWSNAAVLKTVEGHTSGGSNPSSSAERHHLKTRNPVNY